MLDNSSSLSLLTVLKPGGSSHTGAEVKPAKTIDQMIGLMKKRGLAVTEGYRPKCVSVLACVPLWRWAFLLFELYGRGTRGRPECVSGMAGQALRHNG